MNFSKFCFFIKVNILKYLNRHIFGRNHKFEKSGPMMTVSSTDPFQTFKYFVSKRTIESTLEK